MKTIGQSFHLLVFFTYGNSLKTWADAGLMDREILLYKKMVKQGARVTFLTYGDKDDYRFLDQLDGIELSPAYEYRKKSGNRWVNLIRSFFIPFHPELKDLLRSANIYKTNQMSGAWVPIIASLIHKKKLIVRCGYEMLRNMLRDEKKRVFWVIKAILGYVFEFVAYMMADKIVISNKSDRRYIKRFFPVKNKHLHLIRNFIDTDRFCGEQKLLVKKRTALFVGRLETRKNIKNLIYAAEKASCGLDLAGRGRDEAYFETIAAQRNVPINFIGIVSNKRIPDIINQYELFILPSLYENNPKTLLEAMACSRCVIGSDVEGIKELIKDGGNGYLCKTDQKSIKNAIQRFFNASVDELNSMASNARNFVVQECSIDRVYQKEMNLYSDVLS